MTDFGLDYLLLLLLSGGRKLKTLNLAYSREMMGEGIRSTCPQLEHLSLYMCEKLTDPGLDNLLHRWGGPALRSLNLAYTKGWQLLSCSHCQELGQYASWLLIGYTRGNNQSEDRSAS